MSVELRFDTVSTIDIKTESPKYEDNLSLLRYCNELNLTIKFGSESITVTGATRKVTKVVNYIKEQCSDNQQIKFFNLDKAPSKL